MSGKGSKQRPGTGYAQGWDLIKWPTDICPVCGELKAKCGCVPTEDGPGDGEDKPDYRYPKYYKGE